MTEIRHRWGNELQRRENGEDCARHQFWKPLYATIKELEKKKQVYGSKNNSENAKMTVKCYKCDSENDSRNEEVTARDNTYTCVYTMKQREGSAINIEQKSCFRSQVSCVHTANYRKQRC